MRHLLRDSRWASSVSSGRCAGIEKPCSCSFEDTGSYIIAVRPADGLAAGC